ncbi:phosphoenolpyruvate carboxykinase (ATP) [Salipaludibacillus aurantiacus]|uniref:Phosphoenolpyruvate carboxykinase (ATP) n=1 Tax=Salipaludibacillus aurantiacus TaxID=1601833 RepID=A0A1H9WJW3_9BACI|nr:phosphoenolpyruvate carboxykinase (ATP) [Salipaludibacillus aurantiacus]SES34175.1 phosphoenolpyruvate carboxykinase (ATP) [Salipaludibacillus aurantiacus]
MSMIHFEAELSRVLQGENVNKDLSVPHLVEKALERGEGILTSTGAFRATTGNYTGRSPKDKFIVEEPSTVDKIAWGPVNKPISSDIFERLYEKVLHYLSNKDELFVRHGLAGADKNYQLPIRIVNEFAWHNLFVRQLFIRPTEQELQGLLPEFTIVSAPGFKADPAIDGTNSEAFVIVSFEKRTVLIGGTEYAGEMKKSIFSIMNYLLPEQHILPMHCSANVGHEGDVALFFGLSGTGKTTLSADPHRALIGDDEHAWSPNGIFNIEGGCYAKCINLTEEKEPEIFRAIRFGSVLENVVVNELTRDADYEANDYTENTRAAYPLNAIPSSMEPSIAGHPDTIIFLTADAFGVLPPISKLTPEQAMYHFLSGYTSKLAGTERGVTSPQEAFSTCFGEPFLPLPATAYAEMLGDKMLEHNTNVYLVNTGWSGGPYGVGKRMSLPYTRAMVRAALQGDLNAAETTVDPIFGLHIPLHCPGVPDEILQPKHTWADPEAYDQKSKELAYKFKENFKKFKDMPRHIREGGPTV